MTAMRSMTDDQLREVERDITAQKREREHAKWDAELVGRYFRVIRTPAHAWFKPVQRFVGDDYVTLEESLGRAGQGEQFVYADIVYIHIQKRDDNELTCAGFQVSNERRKEPYLKIQPTFYSWSDFRESLHSWGSSGPTKHFDEISKEEYDSALSKAVSRFTAQ